MECRIPGCGDCELLSDSAFGQLKHVVTVQWNAGYHDVENLNCSVTRLLASRNMLSVIVQWDADYCNVEIVKF